MQYHIVFDAIPWASPMEGLRFKALSQGGRRIRLVEYTEAMEPHWCENGHIGVILDGTFEIEFADEAIVFEEGSGVFIPSGHAHRHRARVLEGPVHALFVEEA